MTLTDNYILICNVFIVAVCLEIAVIAQLSKHGHYTVSNDEDSLIALINLGVLACYALFTFVYIKTWVIPR